MVSCNAENHARSKFATILVGSGVVLWIALSFASYLYAANDLIQWR